MSCILLCGFLTKQFNTKVFHQSHTKQPLDTTTQELYWYGLSHCFKHHIAEDPAFKMAKQ